MEIHKFLSVPLLSTKKLLTGAYFIDFKENAVSAVCVNCTPNQHNKLQWCTV